MMLVDAGQIVHVRSRQYLVEDVVSRPSTEEDTLVHLSCLEDDALGEQLEVLWEREVDAKVIGETSWECIVNRGFDNPRLFSAYLHTLRWNCVTSTDPKLFQAPYRAGIELKAYQLEPLRKALLMPRVGLFIADDVDLGKTEIIKLRSLHAAMDRAVLDAYGWTDISTDCDFLLDYEEEEDTESSSGRQKKKPWRHR